PPGALAGHREGGDQDVVEGRSIFELGLELGGLGAQLVVRESLDLRLHLVDRRHNRQHLLHFALVLTAENLGQNRVDHRSLARSGKLGIELGASVYNRQSTRKIPPATPGGAASRRGGGGGT